MALFKISRGSSANLPATLTEGYCWYTYDDSKFYIDHRDENGQLVRKAINAKDAETLTGASLSTILNSSDIEIPTSKAVLDAIDAVTVEIYNTAAVILSDTQEKIEAVNARIDDIEVGGGSSVEVVQETGSSETAVMSQKAVTDSLDTKLDINTETGEHERVYGIDVDGSPTLLEVSHTPDSNWSLALRKDGGRVAVGKPKEFDDAVSLQHFNEYLLKEGYSDFIPVDDTVLNIGIENTGGNNYIAVLELYDSGRNDKGILEVEFTPNTNFRVIDWLADYLTIDIDDDEYIYVQGVKNLQGDSVECFVTEYLPKYINQAQFEEALSWVDTSLTTLRTELVEMIQNSAQEAAEQIILNGEW